MKQNAFSILGDAAGAKRDCFSLSHSPSWNYSNSLRRVHWTHLEHECQFKDDLSAQNKMVETASKNPSFILILLYLNQGR